MNKNDKAFATRVLKKLKENEILKTEGQVEISPPTKLSKTIIKKKVLKN